MKNILLTAIFVIFHGAAIAKGDVIARLKIISVCQKAGELKGNVEVLLENSTQKIFNYQATDYNILFRFKFLDTRGKVWIGDYIIHFNQDIRKSLQPSQSVKMKSYFQLKSIDYYDEVKDEEMPGLSGDLYLSHTNDELLFNKVPLKNIKVCN